MTLPPRRKKERVKPDGVIRCPGHLAWVRSHGCIVHGCNGGPTEAAHVRRGSDGGTGMKPGDDRAISLCRAHHREQHAIGEPAFERYFRIDMVALAAEFAARSPPLLRMRLKVQRDERPLARMMKIGGFGG